MEILNVIIDRLFNAPENITMGIAPLAIAAIAAAPGIIKSVGSMFGSGKRRDAQQAAARELSQRKQAYEQFQFINPYEGLENVYEDARVSTRAAEFQAQQEQQGLAQTLDALRSAGGGAGAAALAQALAQQQARNLQASSADIARQEQQIEMAKMGEASRLQQLEAQGTAMQQEFELGRTETLLDMSAEEKLRADAAREAAKQDLIGGISEAVGAGGGAYLGAVDSGPKNYKKSFKMMGKWKPPTINTPPLPSFANYTNPNPFTS